MCQLVYAVFFMFLSFVRCTNLTLGFYNLNQNGSVWLPTFNDYLGPALQDRFNIGLTFQSFNVQQDLVDAVQNNQVNLVYVNPGLMVCFFTMFDVDLIAGLVNNVSGFPAISYGGDIIVRNESSIQNLNDMYDKSIIAGPPYSTGVFQLQAKFLRDNAFNVFVDPSLIAFEPEQTKILSNVLNGVFDIAFFRADQISANLALAGLNTDVSRFRILSPRTLDYPFPVTTNLYPEWCLGALPNISEDIKKLISQTLLNIPLNSAGPVAAKYVSWTTPFNYYPYVDMLTDIGVMDESGRCILPPPTNYYDFVDCPAGEIKLSLNDVNKRCSSFSAQCSSRPCVCSPCYRPNNRLLYGLSPLPAWCITFGISLMIILISWITQASIGRHFLIPEIQRSHLTFTDAPVIVCQSRYAPIIKASLFDSINNDSMPVSVHCLLPTMDSAFIDLTEGRQDQPLNWLSKHIWKRAADACSFSHPHLIKAYGIVKHNGELWLILDYNETGTLYDFISNRTITMEMGDILRLLKEIALALQFLHNQDPPVTMRVNLYNVMLDKDRGAQLMMSDNFYPQNKTKSADIYCFGKLMLHMVKGLFPDSEPHDLQRKLQDPFLLIRDCCSPNPMARPDINDVLKRLSQCILIWTAEEAKVALAKEAYLQTQTDLLHSMLPRRIAARLHQGLTVEPEHHASVSILFTDIVGFTNISSRLQPHKVADMLDRLYCQFDNLTKKYDLFKIETIGDSLMVAGNLHKHQSNHMARMARFAEELVNTARSTPVDSDLPDVTLNIRVGINVGPVVASVVGKLNPRYCLFGNAVNLASRMESTSIAGHIQLSNKAAELLFEQAPSEIYNRLVKRLDKPDIKGLGHLSTYWLSLETSD